MINVGVIILAAGGSSRLGSPKQLIRGADGVSLIQKISELVMSLNCKQKLMVLGSHHKNIQSEIKEIDIPIIINHEWQRGISSSILAAMDALTKKEDLEGLMFLVCDQPYLNKKMLENLLTKFQNTSRFIVASRYRDVIGTPAIFHKSLFPELLKLTGDKGAGKIINENSGKVALVDFENGIFDIDTPEDLNTYLQSTR